MPQKEANARARTNQTDEERWDDNKQGPTANKEANNNVCCRKTKLRWSAAPFCRFRAGKWKKHRSFKA